MEDELEFNKSTNIRDYRRHSIIRFSGQGISQKAIAEGLSCSQGLVSQVLSAYGKEGLRGIEIQTPPGAKSQLDEDDLSELKTCLLEGARVFGYATDHWTRPRVRALIEEKFAVHYRSLSSVGSILAKIGFT